MGLGGQRHAPAVFTSWKDPVPIVQETGWAPGPVWTGAENLAPTGIRSPAGPARSESLYRLCLPGPVPAGKKPKWYQRFRWPPLSTYDFLLTDFCPSTRTVLCQLRRLCAVGGG